MPFNFYDTHTLLLAVQGLTPAPSFLRDRYFPTNDATDLFATTDVLAEYRDGTNRLAPFVAPRKGGVTVNREGYTMRRFTPPNIAPRRMLSIDDLSRRGFGEALYTNMTPEQRQQVYILADAEELGAYITRREEAMAAETLLTNGCVMKHIADDLTKADVMEVKFYDDDDNPASYTVTTEWDEAGAKILDDIAVMAAMLAKRGLPATDLIVPPNVAAVMINDESIQKLLDIAGYNLGSVEPIELTAGASRIAVLNVYGRMINVICYEQTYTDDDGDEAKYIPDGKIILTAPACGRTVYGAISQVEQSDGLFHTYTGRRVPKYISDAYSNTRSLTITSAPLLIPNNLSPFVSATVIS